MEKKIIVTIDGLSSCGKSTLARQLAKKLGYIFVDSGAMYRAITVYFLRNNVDFKNEKEIKLAIENISIDFILNAQTEKSEIYLNGENVEYIIRDLVVAEKVSDVAAMKHVREFAVAAQQKLGKEKGLVMDGRDIGTTVFPHAEIKFFMTADETVRVTRRFAEMSAKNPNITLEEVKNNIAMRDYIDSNREFSPLRKAVDAIELDNIDSNREFSPLRKAADAIELDNTNLSEKDQLDIALKMVKEKIRSN